MTYTRKEYDCPIQPQSAHDYTKWFLLGAPFFETPGSQMRWRGWQILKTPSDLWVYQEILWDVRPQLVIEFGTFGGGSALFLADLMMMFGIPGKILSIDIAPRENLPEHALVRFHTADALSDEAMSVVEQAVRECQGPVLVIEDSDHCYSHVLSELRMYHRFVTPGSYYIVEDTYAGLGEDKDWPTSVARAVMEFVNERPEFEVDWAREKFRTTTCHGGFLRRR